MDFSDYLNSTCARVCLCRVCVCRCCVSSRVSVLSPVFTLLAAAPADPNNSEHGVNPLDAMEARLGDMPLKKFS